MIPVNLGDKCSDCEEIITVDNCVISHKKTDKKIYYLRYCRNCKNEKAKFKRLLNRPVPHIRTHCSDCGIKLTTDVQVLKKATNRATGVKELLLVAKCKECVRKDNRERRQRCNAGETKKYRNYRYYPEKSKFGDKCNSCGIELSVKTANTLKDKKGIPVSPAGRKCKNCINSAKRKQKIETYKESVKSCNICGVVISEKNGIKYNYTSKYGVKYSHFRSKCIDCSTIKKNTTKKPTVRKIKVEKKVGIDLGNKKQVKKPKEKVVIVKKVEKAPVVVIPAKAKQTTRLSEEEMIKKFLEKNKVKKVNHSFKDTIPTPYKGKLLSTSYFDGISTT